MNAINNTAQNVDTVRKMANGKWSSILSALGIRTPDGPKKYGPCPACGGKDRFRFDDQEGRGTWYCNQCEPRAGDGFSLVQNVKRCDFQTAVGLVARIVNLPSPSTPLPKGNLGRDLFVYHHAHGKPVICVKRIEFPGGKKTFSQWGPTIDGQGWQRGLSCAPKPRPLYRLPAILADASSFVLFHEGEKACEAALGANLPGIHTTTLGGALNPSQTDFSPLKGRDIVICPDNDEAGEKYAQAVARLAHEVGVRSVKVLRLLGLPPKGDIVEWREAGGTSQTFTTLLEEAIVYPADDNNKDTNPTTPLSLSNAVIRLEDLRSMKLPERKRHLPWLPENSIVMIYGARGVGKTMLQLSLGAALGSGTSFLKWPIAAPTGTLYVDGEMPLDELKARITKLVPSEPAMLQFLTSDTVYQSSQRNLVLTSESMRAELDQLLDTHPEIRVLILDNISCLFTGINEDKKQEWEPINAWLLRLRHRGLSIVLVHHAGKGGQQRGTSGREDALDTVIQLSLPADYDPKEGCHFELCFTKSRSVKGDDVAPLDVKLEELDGRLRWRYKLVEESRLDKVRRLKQEGVTSPTQIAEEIGISKGYASKLLHRLKEENEAA